MLGRRIGFDIFQTKIAVSWVLVPANYILPYSAFIVVYVPLPVDMLIAPRVHSMFSIWSSLSQL